MWGTSSSSVYTGLLKREGNEDWGKPTKKTKTAVLETLERGERERRGGDRAVGAGRSEDRRGGGGGKKRRRS